jgi:hypothetical protein
MEVLGSFEMLSVIISHYIGVAEGRQDLEFGMQLLAFFL